MSKKISEYFENSYRNPFGSSIIYDDGDMDIDMTKLRISDKGKEPADIEGPMSKGKGPASVISDSASQHSSYSNFMNNRPYERKPGQVRILTLEEFEDQQSSPSSRKSGQSWVDDISQDYYPSPARSSSSTISMIESPDSLLGSFHSSSSGRINTGRTIPDVPRSDLRGRRLPRREEIDVGDYEGIEIDPDEFDREMDDVYNPIYNYPDEHRINKGYRKLMDDIPQSYANPKSTGRPPMVQYSRSSPYTRKTPRHLASLSSIPPSDYTRRNLTKSRYPPEDGSIDQRYRY